MKTIKSALISLAMNLLFFNIAVANNYIPVIKVVEKKLYLSLENVSTQTSVRIQDCAGTTLMEVTALASGPFESILNLESLPLGSYTLIVKSYYKQTVQPITINRKGLVLDERKRSEYFPANFSKKQGNLKLSLLNPTNSVVRVFIIDQAGHVRYQDAIKDQLIIEREFNLKQLPAGKYTVIVDNANEVYTRNVNLR